MRLIDADAMRQEWLENGQNEYVYDTNAVLDSIDAQPTIEAAPVRHGRWVKLGQRTHGGERNYTHYCSKCGQNGFDDYARCPNCGAKMDGDSHV